MPALEIVTLIHSVRAWQRFHGEIDLYTDAVGYTWMAEHGLTSLYRRIDAHVLTHVDIAVFDPVVYPALGKIIALGAVDQPVTLLDTDLYLERPIHSLGGDGFICAHFEAVGNEIYPAADVLPDPNGTINPTWNFSQCAANMAIAYFGAPAHTQTFVATALSYAASNNATSPVHPVARQVFAEQRIAPFEAARLGLEVSAVCPTTWDPVTRAWLDGPPYAAFHHTWREKNRLSRDQVAGRQYISREVVKLITRFPEESERLLELAARGALAPLLDENDVSILTRHLTRDSAYR